MVSKNKEKEPYVNLEEVVEPRLIKKEDFDLEEIIPHELRAPKRAYEFVENVCRLNKLNPKGGIVDACRKLGFAHTSWYFYIKKYPDCRLLAEKAGLIKTEKPKESTVERILEIKEEELRVIEQLQVDETQFINDILNARRETLGTEFDGKQLQKKMRAEKIYTEAEKKEKKEKIISALGYGTPFATAVRSSGISVTTLNKWIEEEPEIMDELFAAEARWAVTYFKCLTKAAIEAGNRGKFTELLRGAERRFATQWGPVLPIDVSLKASDEREIAEITEKHNKEKMDLRDQLEAELEREND